jgi:TRAP-type C4-dicarboxylate transport system permease small subunit
MAMNGINIVYATTAMEYIFNTVCCFKIIVGRMFLFIQVFLRMGFSQSELDEYFTGPAFLAW